MNKPDLWLLDDPQNRELVDSYYQQSTEMASSELDRKILDAAQRSIESTTKKTEKIWQSPRFLNRLKAPVALAGASVMTLVIAQVIWPLMQGPQSRGLIEIAEPAPTSQVVMAEDEVQELGVPINTDLLREAAADTKVPQRLARDKASLPELYDAPEDDALLQSQYKKKQQEMQERIKRIRELATAGDFISMNEEIRSFQSMYPDYPIFEEVKNLIQ